MFDEKDISMFDDADFCPEDIPLTPVYEERDEEEWFIGSGGYEVKLPAEAYPIDYDIYARVERRASKRGYSTIGWSVRMFQHREPVGKNEEEILAVNVKTLKSAKEVIYGRIKEIHS